MALELDICNEVVTHDMIYKINSLFRFIETNSVDMLDQFDIVCQLGNGIKKFSVANPSSDSSDGLKFISNIIKEKYVSLMANKKKYFWAKSRKDICSPSLWAKCDEIIDFLVMFLTDFLKPINVIFKPYPLFSNHSSVDNHLINSSPSSTFVCLDEVVNNQSTV